MFGDDMLLIATARSFFPLRAYKQIADNLHFYATEALWPVVIYAVKYSDHNRSTSIPSEQPRVFTNFQTAFVIPAEAGIQKNKTKTESDGSRFNIFDQ